MKNLHKIQLIIFKKTENKVMFLLLKRITSKGKIWQGVTGGVEDFDTDLEEACVRELKEELQLAVNKDSILGPFEEFTFKTNRKGYEGQIATEHIFAVQTPSDFVPSLSPEHSEFQWLEFNKAVNLIDFNESKKVIRLINSKYSK